MSFARTIAEQENEQTLTIHAIAPNKESLPYASELQSLAQTSPRVKCTTHFTQDNGRITGNDVTSIAKLNPDADYYICGPKAFEEMCFSALRSAGISKERIFVELFVHAGAPIIQ